MPEPGEVIFIDDAAEVSARRWCWRQSLASASGPGTREVMITVEGHHDHAADDVSAALRDLRLLLEAHAPPTGSAAAIVDAHQPVFCGLEH